MEKHLLRKNKLDLEFHGESQKANAFLIFLTTGILAFLGTFLWQQGKSIWYVGLFVTIVFSFIGLRLYRKSIKRMKEILSEIEGI